MSTSASATALLARPTRPTAAALPPALPAVPASEPPAARPRHPAGGGALSSRYGAGLASVEELVARDIEAFSARRAG